MAIDVSGMTREEKLAALAPAVHQAIVKKKAEGTYHQEMKNPVFQAKGIVTFRNNDLPRSALTDITDHVVGSVVLPKNKSQLLPAPPAAMANFQDLTPESQQGRHIAEATLESYQKRPHAKTQEQKDYEARLQQGETGAGAGTPPKDETLSRLQQQAAQEKKENDASEAAFSAYHDRYIHDQDAKDMDAMTPEERKTLTSYGNYLKLQRADASSEMGPEPGEEEAVPREYQDLVEKYGASRLAELYETASRDAALEQRQQVQQAAQRQSQGAFGGTIASLATIPASAVGGPVALMSRLKDSKNSTGRYNSLSPYTAGDALNVWSDSVRQNVGQQIAGDGSNVLRQGASILYQAGMGTVDSVAKAIVLGPTAAAATSAMGSYARTLSDASKKGATASQAVLLATANAALDYAMDKIPLDQLSAFARNGSTSALKAALKQAGIEVTTEGASFLGSQLLEMEILQGNSEYAQSIQAYMRQGLSQSDATFQANKDLIAQAGQQILIAGLSGGVSAGVSTAIGNARNRTAAEDATTDTPAAAEATDSPATQQTPVVPREQPVSSTPVQQPETAAVENTVPVVQPTEDEFASWGRNPSREGVQDPMADRPYSEAGKRSTKAYMYENPEAKPYFQEQALWLLNELQDTTKGERNYNDEAYYTSGGQSGITGTKRHTSDSIAELLDSDGMSYDQIERGLNAIITDNGSENNAASKKIEYVINKRLMDGYTDFYTGKRVPGNEGYLNMLRDAQPESTPISIVSRMAEDIGSNATARQQQTQENLRSVQDQVAALTGTPTDSAPSIGAADQNFTGTARYQELLSDDNVKPARRDDFRGDEVPEMDGSQRVSDVAKNLIGSKNTTDAGADQVKQLIDSGVFSYDPKSNKQSLQEAYDDLNARGAQSVRNDILRHLADNSIEDGDVTKAVVLANQYIQTGDETSAAEMMSDLSLLAQKSGRNLQLFSLIRRMTPEGQMDVLQKAADKMLSQGKQPKETRGKASSSGPSGRPKTSLTHADIPVELKNQYIEAARSKDTAKIDAATRAIAQAVGSQYHATFKEKWDAWRYMCMLGNASTNVRNIAGNAIFKPYTVVKDELAAIFEKALPKDQRTKAMHTDKDLLAWAKEDTKSVDAQNALKYSAKMGDDVTSDIMSENKRVFKSGALETARKVTEWAPSAGDMIFKNGYYAKYLANFLTARGISADDVRAGKVDTDVMAQARQYAVNNAYINTFNDRNNFSDAVASLGRAKSSKNPVSRAFGTAVDAVLPFRRTPANILVRFKEYSPVEFASAGIKLAKGKITASEFCNSVASGLTGSAAMALGAALAHGITDSKGNGVRLITKATEDEKLQGKQDYSVEVTVNGKTYSATVDWAAPANLPLFVGTNLYKAVTENGESGGDFVDGLIRVADASKDTLEPMLSLSCLSSVNDLLQNIKYSEDGSHIYKIAASAATSYLTQGIPSLLRQTGTFLQTEKQTTFANDDRKEVRGVQRALSNIPFAGDALGLKTDKIDVWGQKQSTGNVAQRAFNAYLNPSKISKVTSDATTAELERLSKTEYGTGVVPEVAPKTITYTDNQGVTHKDVRLTAQQWESYATTRGQTSKQILDKLVRSSDYAKLGDAGKAAAIDLVYKYADKTGAIKAMSDHDGYPDSWMQEAADSKNPGAYIIQKVNNQQMKTAMDNLTKAWAHKTDRPAAKQALEAAYDAYSKSSADVKKAVMDAAEGAVKQYMEARADGFNSNVSLSIIKQVQSIPQKNRQKVAYQYQAVANTKGLSEAQLDKAMKLYMPDYDPSAKKPAKTEVKYDYIRQELGFSAKEYAKAAYAMQDMSYDEDDSGSITKDEAVQAIVDLGFDKETATRFYQIYHGSSNSAKATLKKFIEENY